MTKFWDSLDTIGYIEVFSNLSTKISDWDTEYKEDLDTKLARLLSEFKKGEVHSKFAYSNN